MKCLENYMENLEKTQILKKLFLPEEIKEFL